MSTETVVDAFRDRTSVHRRTTPLLGFIVNPVAGMGGSVGLKGTDGEAIVHEAMRRGARPKAGERAAKAIVRLTASLPQVNVLTVAGPMGEQVAREAGIEPRVLDLSHARSSTRVDTRMAAESMVNQGVDLILFAGGDGTARDILGASSHQVPMLGCLRA
jgi:predicted polyphosphate/ATP-dependent NAD kinase